MKINGKNIPTLAVFPSMMTVADCAVVSSNKIGRGHGEAKFYIASKQEMYDFYGSAHFKAKCFMLKTDLVAYMNAIKDEYLAPSQAYYKKDSLPQLWVERTQMINAQPDMVEFTIADQSQIAGSRGYVNSEDDGYQIIRQIALPLVSYVYAEKIGDEDNPLYYWKLFVDFEAIWEKRSEPLVLIYGKQKGISPVAVKTTATAREQKTKLELSQARIGQGKYRERLLEQCRYCPITMISDERLLVASHIKPWAACNDREKIDPYNRYMLSPMYDKLFDRGFITFTNNRHVILSEFISPFTWKQIGIKNNAFINTLPMDDKRIEYLKFHHESVFKGLYSE